MPDSKENCKNHDDLQIERRKQAIFVAKLNTYLKRSVKGFLTYFAKIVK